MSDGIDINEQQDGSALVLGQAVSREDCQLIKQYREKAYAGWSDGSLSGIRELYDVSVAFPNTRKNPYYWTLEKSLTRDRIGSIRGEKQHRARKGQYVSSVLEYACALLRGSPNLFFEYFRFAADPSRIVVLLNGRELASLSLPSGPFKWWHTWIQKGPNDVFVDGEHYGRIVIVKSKWTIAPELHLNRGGRLELPFQFGTRGFEALLIILRILLLTPLWSKHVPPNEHRVIRRPDDVTLTDGELVVYFAVAVYVRAAVVFRGQV